MPFACSICEQESTRICAFCTKDACNIHLCARCSCCSDCCPCEVPLNEPMGVAVAEALQAQAMPDVTEFMPADLTLPHEPNPDLRQLDAEFAAPTGEPAAVTPQPGTPPDSQPAAPGELADEPPETPEV